MNHADSPFYVLIKGGKLHQAYEEINFNKPFVSRPRDANDDVFEARDTLGACLGFAILKTQLANGPKNVSIKLFEEEEDYEYPPVVFQLNLEGTIFFTKFFETEWAETKPQLLTDPKPLPPSIPLVRKA